MGGQPPPWRCTCVVGDARFVRSGPAEVKQGMGGSCTSRCCARPAKHASDCRTFQQSVQARFAAQTPRCFPIRLAVASFTTCCPSNDQEGLHVSGVTGCAGLVGAMVQKRAPAKSADGTIFEEGRCRAVFFGDARVLRSCSHAIVLSNAAPTRGLDLQRSPR